MSTAGSSQPGRQPPAVPRKTYKKPAPPKLRTKPKTALKTQVAKPKGSGSLGGRQACKQQKIVAVEWVDGDRTTAVTRTLPPAAGAKARQYVNLPAANKWVDAQTRNTDRLSRRVRVRVRFNLPGAEHFRWYMLRLTTHPYSATEEAANANYTRRPAAAWQHATTDADGKKVLTVGLTACGGDQYVIVARDDYGNEKQSVRLETWRRVYLKTAKMQSVPDGDLGTVRQGLIDRLKLHYIDAVPLPDEHDLPYRPVVEDADLVDFMQELAGVDTDADVTQHLPYVIVLAWIRCKGSQKLIRKVRRNITLKVGSRRNPSLSAPLGGRTPWTAIQHPDDWQHRRWWRRAKFRYTDARGRRKEVDLTADQMTLTFRPGSTDELASVDIDLNRYVPKFRIPLWHNKRITGKLLLEVNVVQKTLGIAMGRVSNLTGLCQHGSSAQVLEDTAVHEVGHMCGMVPQGGGGGGRGLDKGAYQYDGRDHDGPHCHKGVNLPLPAGFANIRWSTRADKPECVMFGDNAPGPAARFCDQCSKAMRKVDLSAGWRTFSDWLQAWLVAHGGGGGHP